MCGKEFVYLMNFEGRVFMSYPRRAWVGGANGLDVPDWPFVMYIRILELRILIYIGPYCMDHFLIHGCRLAQSLVWWSEYKVPNFNYTTPLRWAKEHGPPSHHAVQKFLNVTIGCTGIRSVKQNDEAAMMNWGKRLRSALTLTWNHAMPKDQFQPEKYHLERGVLVDWYV